MSLSVIKLYSWGFISLLTIAAIFFLSGCVYLFEQDHPPRESWKEQERAKISNSKPHIVMNNFESGAVVVLKSGGAKMTVSGKALENEFVNGIHYVHAYLCVSEQDGVIKREIFESNTLELYSKP
jgi:uncharacterized protein YodC (DUF2158 family)